MIKQLLFDQTTPVSMYGKIKKLFKEGAMERIVYKDNQTLYTNKMGQVEKLDVDPFDFLQTYYQNLDQNKYQKIADEVGFSFVDGFIGFIGYDMVKVFEPTLKVAMDNLYDPLNTPDLDLVRPSIILAYSHKNSMLTIIQNDKKYTLALEKLEAVLKEPHNPQKLKAGR